MLKEIQYLRGIAALMVVTYHTYPQLKRIGYDGVDFVVMSGGVDIFFVISGFIMTYISYGCEQSAGAFLRDRFLRIAPLYWILTSVVAAIRIATPALLQASVVQTEHFIVSMLFLPAPHPVLGLLFPLLVPGWTLNYEMYFYLIFSLFVGMTTRYRYLFAILAVVASTSLTAALPLDVVSKFYGDPIVLEFCYGIALGMVYSERRSLFSFHHGAAVGALIGVTGFAMLFGFAALHITGSRAWTMGLPALIIVAGALVSTRASYHLNSRWLEKIGDASYSISRTS